MGVRIGDYYVCKRCGKVEQVKYSGRPKKYCTICAEMVHKEQIHKHNEERRIETRSLANEYAEKRVEPVTSKPQYTLAEMNAAARENNMSYGQYSVALANGTVKPPDKKPDKGKRGRKKGKKNGN